VPEVVPLDRRAVAVFVVGFVVLVTTSIVVVHPGLPYDEPAHYANVLAYLHGGLPRIGAPGTSYETQQPPLAYVVAVPFLLIGRALGGLRGGFDAVRALGGLELALALVGLERILRRLLPTQPWARLAGLGLLGWNPMIVVMSASVENDAAALALGLWALAAALAVGPRPSRRASFGLGALVALALLAKLTAWPLIFALPIWWLVGERGREFVARSAVYLVGLAVIGLWWPIRNLVLYGGLLGRSYSAKAFHNHFVPYRLTSLHALIHTIVDFVTYLWEPTEYLRNTIVAPLAVRGVVGVVTVGIVVVAAVRLVRSPALRVRGELRSSWGLVVLAGLLAVAGWLVVFATISSIAPRLAYVDLAAWAALGGLAAAGHPLADRTHERVPPSGAPPVVRRGEVAGVAGLGLVLLGLSAWTLRAASTVPLHFIRF
jgi:hypothetical protein